MDWMYKNSSETIDREEYLLGRAIDKNFESQLSGSFNEVDRDITPASIFSNSGSNLQVDVVRKLKEDPLEQIRQKELENRKQLLKNPVKLKKLQNMLKAKRDKDEKLLKKKTKKNKKKSNESALDEILTSKFLKMKDKLGEKILEDIGTKGTRKSDEESSKESNKTSRKAKKKISNSSSSESSASSDTSFSEEEKYGKKKYKKEKQTMKRKHDDHEEESKPNMKTYGLEIRGYHERSSDDRNRSSSSYLNRKLLDTKKAPIPDKSVRKKLTEEEKAQRLKEMTQNADWRKQLSTKGMKRYKDEQRKERNDDNKNSFDEGFFRRQMALATSHTTVQERIKSKVNYIQRSESDMDKNFARR